MGSEMNCGSAAPLGQVRPLQQALPRVDEGRRDGRHVGGRQHPRQAGGVEVHAPPPPLARDDVQLAAEVRRTLPLSLRLLRLGGEPIVPALVRALKAAVT